MSKSNNPAAGRRGRDPNKESFWRKRLSLHDRSGLTVRAFCEREGVKETTFHFWRQEIRRRDRESMGEPTPALSFVELHATPLPAAVAAVEGASHGPVLVEAPLELLLPGDRRLLIRAGCDARLLQLVVAALASVSLPNRPALSLPKGEGRSC